jgi:hypothetical protein
MRLSPTTPNVARQQLISCRTRHDDLDSVLKVPLELAVEAGIPGLLAGLALLVTSLRLGFAQLHREMLLSLPALGSLAAVVGLAGHGLVDTIFFRPEVQITGWFLLATIGAAQALSQSNGPSDGQNHG